MKPRYVSALHATAMASALRRTKVGVLPWAARAKNDPNARLTQLRQSSRGAYATVVDGSADRRMYATRSPRSAAGVALPFGYSQITAADVGIMENTSR